MTMTIWEAKIAPNRFAQSALGNYPNIKALLQEMPYDPDNDQLLEAGNKLQNALTVKTFGIPRGVNSEFANKLDAALANKATRAKIVKLSKEDPAALNHTIDKITKNPENTVAIVNNIPARSGPIQVAITTPPKLQAPIVAQPENTKEPPYEVIKPSEPVVATKNGPQGDSTSVAPWSVVDSPATTTTNSSPAIALPPPIVAVDAGAPLTQKDGGTHPNYHVVLDTNLANTGTGKIDREELTHYKKVHIHEWDINGSHMTVIDARDDHGNHIRDTSVTSAEGTRTTHSVGGKMVEAEVVLNQSGSTSVIASRQELDSRGKLVETINVNPSKPVRRDARIFAPTILSSG